MKSSPNLHLRQPSCAARRPLPGFTTLAGLIVLFGALGVASSAHAATLTITGEQLNVYAGPGRTFEVIAVVKQQEKFEILEQQDDWYKISVDGRLGWAPGKGVTILREKTIAELLTQADRYVRQQQLTTPADANAFDLYQEVLRRDPENTQARKQIELMAHTYKTWAQHAEQQGDLEKARIFYQRYLFLKPNEQEVKNALDGAAHPAGKSEETLRLVRLRSDPADVSAEDLQRLLRTDRFNHPADWSKYGLSASLSGTFRHDYELMVSQGVPVVVDYATNLMWQQTGSPEAMAWKEAQDHIQRLNTQMYAGYADWRLPTIEELASLLMAAKQRNHLYLPPHFKTASRWCWSADPVASDPNLAWYVSFSSGGIQPHEKINSAFVIAVRSL